MWRHYEHHPALATAPKTTLTAQGIPGDPLNVGLIGSERDVVRSMLDAGWRPADPTTLRSSLRIAGSVLFDRPDPDAPVSNLYVFGRKQDLAFEKPVGKNARRRHHVRFWETADQGRGGSPLWIGAVTFDVKVGLSRLTGQVTHHIGPDVDADRDALFDELAKAGRVVELFQVTGVGSTLFGRNGGGDPYYTDGELTLGVLAPDGGAASQPSMLPNPVAVRIKEQFWTAIRPLLGGGRPGRVLNALRPNASPVILSHFHDGGADFCTSAFLLTWAARGVGMDGRARRAWAGGVGLIFMPREPGVCHEPRRREGVGLADQEGEPGTCFARHLPRREDRRGGLCELRPRQGRFGPRAGEVLSV